MGRPKEHDDATATALLKAAERAIEDRGVDALSVRGVAADVGVSTRAVYSVFGSREALVAALAVPRVRPSRHGRCRAARDRRSDRRPHQRRARISPFRNRSPIAVRPRSATHSTPARGPLGPGEDCLPPRPRRARTTSRPHAVGRTARQANGPSCGPGIPRLLRGHGRARTARHHSSRRHADRAVMGGRTKRPASRFSTDMIQLPTVRPTFWNSLRSQ